MSASTLIQGIAGKTIQPSIHETTFSGETANKQVYHAEDALAGFEIGHDSKSMTSSLNAFVRINNKSKETVYLDSPGMEDTSGPEMDIATCALLSQVAKRCRSLKFVVVIHCASLIEDRGGAFRGVLKFARKFVADFKAAKTSFMFLFSHSNEIAEMSDTIQNAQKRLLEEIIRTANGTTDKDVLIVLQFIRDSLKKNYPFAGIYRPLEMDFSALTSFVEEKMTKMKELTLASACNLTTASKLKLEGAIQSLIQQLRVSLKGAFPDVATVSDIRTTLHYFSSVIEVDCVRKAAEECKAIIDEQIVMTKSLIEKEVIRGLNSDMEFSTENVCIINQSLQLLAQLDSSFSIDNWHNNNRRRLEKFQREILQKVVGSAITPFYLELKKVAVWANEFVEYSGLYSELISTIGQHFEGISSMMSETDLTNIDQGSPEEINSFMSSYANLYDFCEHVTHFSLEGITLQSLSQGRDATAQKLISLFGIWASDAEKLAKTDLSILAQTSSPHLTAHRVKVIEIIQEVLKNRTFVCSALLDKAKASRKQTESCIVEWYNSCCVSLKERTLNHPQMEPTLAWMCDAYHLFSNLQGGRWKSMQSTYFTLIEKIRTDMNRTAHDLVSRCKMIRQTGISDGQQLAKEFQLLQNCKWFDELSPVEYGGVDSYCIEIGTIIEQRVLEKSQQLDYLIDKLQPQSSQFCEYAKTMGIILPELYQIDKFESLTFPPCHWRSLSSKCVSCLEESTSALHLPLKLFAQHWEDGFKHGRPGYMRSISRKLNCILSKVDFLESTRASDELLKMCSAMSSLVIEKFERCTNAIKLEFSSFRGDFNSKAAFLNSLEACHDFPLVAKQLPKFEELKHHMRTLVTKEAQQIEEEIERSSEWDDIDSRLLIFGSASVLDTFVGQEVSRQLNTLRRMREQKENQVDDRLQNMIRDRSFQQIGSFLVPLASSNDQMKKQKSSAHQSELALDLEGIIHQTKHLLDPQSSPEQNAQTIARSIDTLILAKSELQSLLLPRLNLASEIDELKVTANTTLKRFTDLMHEALESKKLC